MIIAIPTVSQKGLEDKVAEHFGRCFSYTFLDEKGRLVKILKNTNKHMGGSGLSPEFIKKNGASVLLCKNIGPKAVDLCQKINIKIFQFQGDKVKEFFQLWQKTLTL